MLSQVDSEVHHSQLLKDISYHSMDDSALKRSDVLIRSFVRNLHPKKTTRGWKLEVEWKDVSSIWMTLKYIKASNSINLLNMQQQTT